MRGSILLMTLAVVILLVSLAGSFLFATGLFTQQSGWEETDAKLFWLAEAGLHKAIWNYITPPGLGGQGINWQTTGTTESLGDGSYTMVAVRTGSIRKITSTGTITTGGDTTTRSVYQEFKVLGAAGLNPEPDTWREL